MAGQIPNPFAESTAGGQTPQNSAKQSGGGLVSYCIERVRLGREHRQQKYQTRWSEYTRLHRGFHTDADKNTKSERSRLIAPALSQAIEMTVAEMEEAVFNRLAWFDIMDDIADEDKDDAIVYRDQLLEDFELDGVADAVSKCFLMAAIYGTGIAKLNAVKKIEKSIGPNGKVVENSRVSVMVECIRPDEFVIDPSALFIDEAEFVAHEMIKPLWGIKRKQAAGTYRKGPLNPWNGRKADTDGTGLNASTSIRDNGVRITEYFGQVPARMIPGSDGTGMIEAIVTIANETTLLRAVASPFTMKDRPIVAYQHETVPGEFWGRGVAEKGYNPQKALDAELRARIDALAFLSAPMMGADITRMPRNMDMTVKPGKTIFTRGRPSEILEPLSFGNPAILAHTFQHTGDLERMVQMGTGAMDSATPVGINSRNETASGMSQMQSGFIKRSKRTMQNLERQFLDPLVRKALWRYMQFDPSRYPSDLKFKVNATMGIMAKEMENAQLINMLGFVSQDSPAHPILIDAIFSNTASANKAELAEAMAAVNAPPSPEEQQRTQQIQELELRLQIATVSKEEALAKKEMELVKKAEADTRLALAKAEHEIVDTDLADDLVEIQAANAVTGAEKARVTRRQTDVALDRNNIEREKVRKGEAST